MSEHELPEGETQQLPPLLRFLGLHLALGAAIAVAIVSLILMTNLAGLKKLIVEAQNPFIPLLLLYAFNIITFSSVTMGVGIMTMPLEQPEPERESDHHEMLAQRRLEAAQHRRDWTDLS
jgi:hypothetical protein